MTRSHRRHQTSDRSGRRVGRGLLLALAAAQLAGCGFHGLNSLPLPGTKGGGPGSYTVQAQEPNVENLEPNSQVRLNDVAIGSVTKIERQGWHALVTMRINGDVDLPANATATIGQTSLLGSKHVELAAPVGAPPQGKLKNGSLIPLSSAHSYPTTEQTLAGLSLLLNGGGLGKAQDVTKALSTAFYGREQDLRSLIEQLDKFVAYLNDQRDDIIKATDSLNHLVGQFSDEKPVIDKALKTLPDALAVLKDTRENLAEALDQVGKFGALTADSVNQTRENLVKELNDLGPVLQSLADSGPALTRSLDLFTTVPFVNPTLTKWIRGDYANVTAIADLTLSRIDSSLFTGTRWECNLTELELQWGRTIGQLPSPCTGGGPFNPGNPLIAPYHFDQGK
ncbi:MCE family protein [Mycobacterium paraintracellulare]|uniref:MCE family protein n=1 Tax=Mycobacterium paraintracellulare TaxID=1138383 RepID=UPI0019275F8A|nr:MCE family protein [Mycobacterium paraintracellulare]